MTKKSHAAPHFNHLDLKMEWRHLWFRWYHMTPTWVPMVSHDRKAICTSYQTFRCSEYNGVVNNVVGIIPIKLSITIVTIHYTIYHVTSQYIHTIIMSHGKQFYISWVKCQQVFKSNSQHYSRLVKVPVLQCSHYNQGWRSKWLLRR